MIYSYFEIAILPNLVLIGFLNEKFLTFDYLETDHTMSILKSFFILLFISYNKFCRNILVI